MNSTIEPGQPWQRRSGMRVAPLPGSWMKWSSVPPSDTVYCLKRLRRASCARQSKPSFQ